MKYVKRALVAIFWFLFGWIIDWISIRVFIYKKRLQMVPTSFKVFVWILGVIFGASGAMVYYQAPELMSQLTASKTVIYIQPAEVSTAKPEVKEVAVAPAPVDLVDIIFLKESSRGKNNYSKCEAIGKYNRYGYGIPGDGSYMCFDKDEDTKAVAGWVAVHKASGLTDNQLLCKYNTGKATSDCGYLK